MKRLFLVLNCALLIVACNFGTGSKFTPAKPVSIPTTIKQARARHNPPDVSVDVKRKTVKRGGGGSCHVLPVCVIVGAALLYQELFPQKYDVVTITENGKNTFYGKFTTGGDLIHGSEISDETTKNL